MQLKFILFTVSRPDDQRDEQLSERRDISLGQRNKTVQMLL